MVAANIFSPFTYVGLFLSVQAQVLSARCASVHRHLLRFIICTAVVTFIVIVSQSESRSLGSGLGSAFSSRPATSDADGIEFRCQLPENMRLQGNCWIKGATGHYAGERTEDDKMVDGHSQFGEDEFLLEHFFFDRTGGTFIEMGALDGDALSNTYFFERQKGWRGLMIEGSPKLAEKLFRNRPQAVTVNAMICGEERDLHWLDKGAVGGAYELLPQRIIDKFYGDKLEEIVAGAPVVPCVKLGRLLQRFGVRHVDLFSLDVEGAELSVLKTIDFSAFTASVLMMEVQSTSYNKAPPVVYMRDQGYVDYGYIKNNYIFLHPRFAETLPKHMQRIA